MGIHNLMEDEVTRLIGEICDEEERTGAFGYCTTAECRMDAACFVLNRVPQRYVTSGRGIARFENSMSEDPQLSIDLVTLAHEGLRRVSTVRRSFYAAENGGGDAGDVPPGPAYCFPIIRGRLLHGTTFEKVAGVSLRLLLGRTPAEMVNRRWQNPYPLVSNNPGNYLFWPRPIPADAPGDRKSFEFELEIEEDQRYEPFHHLFRVETTSVSEVEATPAYRDFTLQDLFLVPQ